MVGILSFFVLVVFHFGVSNTSTFLYCLLTLLSIFLLSEINPSGVSKRTFSSQLSVVGEEQMFFRLSKRLLLGARQHTRPPSSIEPFSYPSFSVGDERISFVLSSCLAFFFFCFKSSAFSFYRVFLPICCFCIGKFENACPVIYFLFFVSLLDVLFHFLSGVFLGLIIKHLLLIHSLPINLFQPNFYSFPCFNSFFFLFCLCFCYFPFLPT